MKEGIQRKRFSEKASNHRHSQGNSNGPEAEQRAFCFAVNGHELAELRELLRTAGVKIVGELAQKRAHKDQHPHPDTYLGKGKVEELRYEAMVAGATLLVCDDELTSRQERNLEAALELPVIDRTTVILDIFATHAHSAEGNLQVELAQLQYNLVRMRGLWPHLERLGAGIGTRGPGETQIETDRRLARQRITRVKRKLTQLEKSRQLLRQERQASAIPAVALAGYTNAGKSTLMGALTKTETKTSAKLFQTLDPTTRICERNGNSFLATDAVGFIRKIPHNLIEAFKATLEETRVADLILHVVDASEPMSRMEGTIETVEEVLEEIGANTQPRLLVLNKADLLTQDQRAQLAEEYPQAVFVSALTGDGLDGLYPRISRALEEGMVPVELLVPYDRSAVLEQLYKTAHDMAREDSSEGIYVHAKVPVAVAERLQQFAIVH